MAAIVLLSTLNKQLKPYCKSNHLKMFPQFFLEKKRYVYLITWENWNFNFLIQILFYLLFHLFLYGCTTWTLTKHLALKKQDANYTRMLQAVFNKSWNQHPTKQLLYSHLPPISQTIHEKWARHSKHCCANKNDLINDVLLWTPIHGHTTVG